MKIREIDGKYCLYDGDTKLGEYDSEEAAKAAMRAKEAVEAPTEGVFVREVDPTGSEWDVRVLKFGISKNGWEWTRAVAENLVQHLRGAKVGLSSDRSGRLGHPPHDAGAVVGEIHSPRIEEDGVYARLKLNPDVRWLKESLLGLASRGRLADAIGLSVDTIAHVAQRVIQSVKELRRVDIVGEPSADGRFLRATAGPLLIPPTEEDVMNRDQLLTLVKESRPQLLEGKDIAKLTDEDIATIVREAVKPPAPAPQPTPQPSPSPRAEDKPAWFQEFEKRQAITDTQGRVAEAVAATRLPDPVKTKIRKRFEGQVAAADVIAAVVKEEIDTLAAIVPGGDPLGWGHRRAEITAAPRDKVQAALDRLFGVSEASLTKALESAPMSESGKLRILEELKPQHEAAKDPGLRFKSLKDFYVQVTGDVEVTGRAPKRVVEADLLSTDWADILGNTMYRTLLARYAEPMYNERTIARFGSAPDFRTREKVIMGYFGDLSAVAQAAAYVDIANVTDDKVSYAVTKRGNLLSITIETIKNDDLRAVQEMVERLGRAARRTLAQFVWTFWNGAGATYDVDTVAWFNAAHANTGTVALTADTTGAAEVFAKIVQLYAQTEMGSGKTLDAVPLGNLWLDVPASLWSVARRLNISREFGAGVTNQVFGMFGNPDDPSGGERINVNPLFTDVTDWGVHLTPDSGRESIQVDFLDGREEPELLLADLPTQGRLFTNDVVQYKIRHIYGGDLIDFRGASKNLVAG